MEAKIRTYGTPGKFANLQLSYFRIFSAIQLIKSISARSSHQVKKFDRADIQNKKIGFLNLEIFLKSFFHVQRDDYRETCRKLAGENENISDSLYQAERDTIDVISLLKREDIAKFKTIQQLTKKVAELEEIVSKN